eukprot:UN24668
MYAVELKKPDSAEDYYINDYFLYDDEDRPIKFKIMLVPNIQYNYPGLSFVSKGRQIGEVLDLKSFNDYIKKWKKRNPYKKCIFDYHQVAGYIDVGTSVDQVISRDEFTNSNYVYNLYDHLLSEDR